MITWLGHVVRMNKDRGGKQVMNWTQEGGRRMRGRPRKNSGERPSRKTWEDWVLMTW